MSEQRDDAADAARYRFLLTHTVDITVRYDGEGIAHAKSERGRGRQRLPMEPGVLDCLTILAVVPARGEGA